MGVRNKVCGSALPGADGRITFGEENSAEEAAKHTDSITPRGNTIDFVQIHHIT
jgi:hypothetical protein